MIAQLAVAAAVYAIDKPYSYRVPEGMQVQPGSQASCSVVPRPPDAWSVS